MSIRTVTEHVVSCDCDGCGRTAVARRSELDPDGYVLPEGWHRLALGDYMCPEHWRERFDGLVRMGMEYVDSFLDSAVDHGNERV